MLVYGRNIAKELLEKNKNIRKVIIQENFDDKKINSLIENGNFKVEIKSKREIDDLCPGVNQGIILDIPDYEYSDLSIVLEEQPEIIVMLDHLEDPHNLGAIIRTSEAAGVDAIIIPQNREVQINATVMKTSVGTLSKVKVSRVSNIVQTMEMLKKNGFWIVGTAMDGEDYRNINYDGKIALVIGNEGNGMSRLVRENCDFIASIPMYGEVNSLNASVASGIMIYEVIRNRK